MSYDLALAGDEFAPHFIAKLRSAVAQFGGLESIKIVMISEYISRTRFVYLLSALQALGLEVTDTGEKPLPQIVVLDPGTTREELCNSIKSANDLLGQDVAEIERDEPDEEDDVQELRRQQRLVEVNSDLMTRLLVTKQ
ncbi:hypothetical protein HQ524_02225 [Candidatus Uhrbacteria bacterium]|nr:hypothetical protein [Candidatus Uhrbacteria bacterium]